MINEYHFENLNNLVYMEYIFKGHLHVQVTIDIFKEEKYTGARYEIIGVDYKEYIQSSAK